MESYEVRFTAEIEADSMESAIAKARQLVAQGGSLPQARPRPGLWQTMPRGESQPVAIVPLKLIDRAAQCIARAEVEGAYRGCAAPQIGSRTLAWLESFKP